MKHGSPTAEERSWSPTVAGYTRCLVHGSITRLAELKDRWNQELGIFTELDKDDRVQSCLEERFQQGPVSLHTFIENDAKGVALILLDFQTGSPQSCEIECMVYNCMEQQVEYRSWDPKTPTPKPNTKRKAISEGLSRKNARFF